MIEIQQNRERTTLEEEDKCRSKTHSAMLVTRNNITIKTAGLVKKGKMGRAGLDKKSVMFHEEGGFVPPPSNAARLALCPIFGACCMAVSSGGIWKKSQKGKSVRATTRERLPKPLPGEEDDPAKRTKLTDKKEKKIKKKKGRTRRSSFPLKKGYGKGIKRKVGGGVLRSLGQSSREFLVYRGGNVPEGKLVIFSRVSKDRLGGV